MKIVNERIDWTGKWIPNEVHAFEKTAEYSVKQDLIEELLKITKKYQSKLKDKTIIEAAEYIAKKYKI